MPEALEYAGVCYGDLSIGSPCSNDLECEVPIGGGECNRQNKTCSCSYDEFPLHDRLCSSASQIRIVTFYPGILLFLRLCMDL